MYNYIESCRISLIIFNNYFYNWRGCMEIDLKWHLIDCTILQANFFSPPCTEKENLTWDQESLRAFFHAHPFNFITDNTLLIFFLYISSYSSSFPLEHWALTTGFHLSWSLATLFPSFYIILSNTSPPTTNSTCM